MKVRRLLGRVTIHAISLVRDTYTTHNGEDQVILENEGRYIEKHMKRTLTAGQRASETGMTSAMCIKIQRTKKKQLNNSDDNYLEKRRIQHRTHELIISS